MKNMESHSPTKPSFEPQKNHSLSTQKQGLETQHHPFPKPRSQVSSTLLTANPQKTKNSLTHLRDNPPRLPTVFPCANHPSLDNFKQNNEFSQFQLIRYYIPLTRKVATKLGLHKEVKDKLPQSMNYFLFLSITGQAETE